MRYVLFEERNLIFLQEKQHRHMYKNFRTSISAPSYPFEIDHKDKISSIGSCFAEHMSNFLSNYKYHCFSNPFGIQYDPISIGNSLRFLIDNQQFNSDDLFIHEGKWHSFNHHSRFSHPDQETVLSNINNKIESHGLQLRKSKLLILTFGTAFVFKHKTQHRIVANCHKLPADLFDRFMLRPKTIIESLSTVFEALNTLNPAIQILLTVSPVRHIKDGMIDNQRSKSSLLLSVASLSAAFDFVHYFPSYEMMMDDLRDYRFYEEDMIHPNVTAIKYIWSHFSKSILSKASLQLHPRIEKIKAACAHRPFHPDTPEHQKFLNTQFQKIKNLQKAYSFLDFSEELKILRDQVV